VLNKSFASNKIGFQLPLAGRRAVPPGLGQLRDWRLLRQGGRPQPDGGHLHLLPISPIPRIRAAHQMLFSSPQQLGRGAGFVRVGQPIVLLGEARVAGAFE
jgi:hypothetical protein